MCYRDPQGYVGRLLLESLSCVISAAKLLGICSILQLAPVHCMAWCNISSLQGALPSGNICSSAKPKSRGFTSRVPQVPQAKSSSGHNYWGWGTNHHGDAKLRGSCPWEWTQGSILDTANQTRNAGAGQLTCCWLPALELREEMASGPISRAGVFQARIQCVTNWHAGLLRLLRCLESCNPLRLFDVLTLHMGSELRAQLLVSYYILQLGTKPFFCQGIYFHYPDDVDCHPTIPRIGWCENKCTGIPQLIMVKTCKNHGFTVFHCRFSQPTKSVEAQRSGEKVFWTCPWDMLLKPWEPRRRIRGFRNSSQHRKESLGPLGM